MKYIVLVKYLVPILHQEKNFYLFSTLEKAEEAAEHIQSMYSTRAVVYLRELTEDVEL